MAFLIALAAQLAGSGLRPASAQQQPVAVMVLSGIDPLLEDVEVLFDAGDAPEHAQTIRDWVARLGELQGLDRQRPLGVSLFLPSAGEKDPQPLLFFPVSSVDELMASVRIGEDLWIERAEPENRLILHTEDGNLPVRLEHDYAFVDPTKSGERLNRPLADPRELIGAALADHDVALIIRREGIAPYLFDLATAQIQAEARSEQSRKEGETDADYALRLELQEAIFSLLEAFVRDWRSTTIGLRLSARERTVQLDASVSLQPDGQTMQFLREIQGRPNRFAARRQRESAFSLAANWQPTDSGRRLLSRLLANVRGEVDRELAEADDETQEAFTGILDAFEASVAQGASDSFVQLVGTAPEHFKLVGATTIAESPRIAAGLEHLLPLAVESNEVRDIEMNVARVGEIPIHRIWPLGLRKQDRILYGDDATIFLAAGRGAIWVACGGEGTAGELAEAIRLQSQQAGDDPPHTTPDPAAPDGPAYLDLSMHASDWIGLAPPDSRGRKAKVARLAREALADPDEDRLRLWVQAEESGLGLHLRLEPGYVRLIGLALARRLARQ